MNPELCIPEAEKLFDAFRAGMQVVLTTENRVTQLQDDNKLYHRRNLDFNDDTWPHVQFLLAWAYVHILCFGGNFTLGKEGLFISQQITEGYCITLDLPTGKEIKFSEEGCLPEGYWSVLGRVVNGIVLFYAQSHGKVPINIPDPSSLMKAPSDFYNATTPDDLIRCKYLPWKSNLPR